MIRWLDSWDDSYYSHNDKARGEFQGYLFQVKLLMFFISQFEIMKNEYQFYLGTEVNAAYPFDDLVIRYKKGNDENSVWTHRLLQAKHRLYPNKEKYKISKNDLNTSEDGPFSIQKYFIGFCKIIKNQLFLDENNSIVKIKDENNSTVKIKDVVIITNTDFGFDESIKSGTNTEKDDWESFFIQDKDVDEFFESINKKKMKLDTEKRDKILQKIYELMEKKKEYINNLREIDANNQETIDRWNDIKIDFEKYADLFIDKLRFITNFPSVYKLDELIEKSFNTKYRFKRKFVNDFIQNKMIDYLKWYDIKQGHRNRFYNNDRVEGLFQSLT